MKLKITLLVGALLLMTSPVWASTITFDFTNCSQISSPTGFGGTACHNTSLGQNTATYTSGGLNIVATGLNGSNPDNLYVKFQGSDENGLGLVGASDHEIHPGQSIYLDLSDLVSHGITSGTLWLGSLSTENGVQEVAQVCASSAVGTPGSVDCVTYNGVSSGSLSEMVSWSGSDPILSIIPSSGGMLVGEKFTVASPVPEPSSMALFGTMLLAFAFAYYRLRDSKVVS